LIFFMLAPVYRLLGGSARALEVSAAFVNAVAVCVAVFMAWRWRSLAVVGAVSVGLALLMLGYGASLLTGPWNPHFPVLWFAVFLVAVWAVACGDLGMLLVVVTTASICAQTHIPYVAVCGALGLLAAGNALWLTLRAPRASSERRRGLRILAGSLALLVVLWLPPLIDQLRGEPGNARRLIGYFSDSNNPTVGLRQALSVVLTRFDAWHVVIVQLAAPGGFNQPWPGLGHAGRAAVTLSVWVLCALAAPRLRSRPLSMLHGLVLAGIVVAVLAASRIIGFAFNHVLFWSWALVALLIVACLATIGSVIAQSCPKSLRPRLAPFGTALVVIAVAGFAGRLALASMDVLPIAHRQSRLLKAVSVKTVEGIERGTGLATGPSGRYLVSWFDSMYGGALGIGLANELERAGFQAAYEPNFAPLVGVERTRDREWATARIHFAAGRWIDTAARVPGALEVARVDLRTPDEKRQAKALRATIVKALRQAHRRDLVRKLDYDVHGTIAAEPSLDPLIVLSGGMLTDIGGPVAVFVMPPNAI
jgi:hypothetical protein